MKRDEAIRVLCADNHPAMRKGIASILANEPDMILVGEADDGQVAVELFRLRHPDVTLMDLRMPRLGGIEAIRLIRKESPQARIIALTSYDGDQDIYRALAAGVWGYLLKDKAHTEIARAIRMVHSGERLPLAEVAEHLRDYPPEVALTPREVQVLRLAAQGLSNKDISEQLGAMFGTVKIHIQNILCKLRAADRTHAVTIALHRGIIHLDELKNKHNAGVS